MERRKPSSEQPTEDGSDNSNEGDEEDGAAAVSSTVSHLIELLFDDDANVDSRDAEKKSTTLSLSKPSLSLSSQQQLVVQQPHETSSRSNNSPDDAHGEPRSVVSLPSQGGSTISTRRTSVTSRTTATLLISPPRFSRIASIGSVASRTTSISRPVSSIEFENGERVDGSDIPPPPPLPCLIETATVMWVPPSSALSSLQIPASNDVLASAYLVPSNDEDSVAELQPQQQQQHSQPPQAIIQEPSYPPIDCDQDPESESTSTNGRHSNKALYRAGCHVRRTWIVAAAFALMCLCGMVILILVVFARPSGRRNAWRPVPRSSTITTPTLTSTLELYQAVDAYYFEASSTDKSSPTFSPIGTWDVSRITNFTRLFDRTRSSVIPKSFDEDLAGWDVSSATTLSGMFAHAINFTGRGLEQWNTTSVTDMSRMFAGATAFRADLSSWNVANVQDMSSLFQGALSISNSSGGGGSTNFSMWNVSHVQSTQGMFANSGLSSENLGTLNGWDVSRVTNMRETFAGLTSQFTMTAVSAWNVSAVQDASFMFQGAAAFDNNLCHWRWILPTNARVEGMFFDTACPEASTEVWLPFGPLCHACDMPQMPIAFTTTDELYRAVDLYLAHPDDSTTIVAMGYGHPIGTWNVSLLSNFTRVFDPDRTVPLDLHRASPLQSNFNEDISQWDLSSAKILTGMFAYASSFNGNLSTWNTSSAVAMDFMFAGASSFDGDVNSWDVSKVKTLTATFFDATSFDGSLSLWNVGSVMDLSSTFRNAAAFDSDISTWNVSAVRSMDHAFDGATSFAGDLSLWDVSNVYNTSGMFQGAKAWNGNMSLWNVSLVQDQRAMFRDATSFEGRGLSQWDVGRVKDTSFMFFNALKFNSNLSAWNVGAVRHMDFMFFEAPVFSSDISAWNVHAVQSMESTLEAAFAFNSDIGRWNVSSVTNMAKMLRYARLFNQDISAWDVSRVHDMNNMLFEAVTFNQDLCAWGERLDPTTAIVTHAFKRTACANGMGSPILPHGPLCASCSVNV